MANQSKKKKNQWVSATKKKSKVARFSIYSCTNSCGSGCACLGDECDLNPVDDCSLMDPAPELGSLDAAAPSYATYEVPDGSNTLLVQWDSDPVTAGIECQNVTEELSVMLDREFYIFQIRADQHMFIRMSYYPSYTTGTVLYVPFTDDQSQSVCIH